jgi:hypothetical protein
MQHSPAIQAETQIEPGLWILIVDKKAPKPFANLYPTAIFGTLLRKNLPIK